MAYSDTCEAIVLRVIDVGEADRFCILFTRERGKMAVRARGVRKLKSVMGGNLLPLRHISIDIKKTRSGWVAAGVRALGAESFFRGNITAFAYAMEGMELLLHLVHDDEPLPNIFDATLAFLHLCATEKKQCVLAFTARVLHLLGVLPGEDTAILQQCSSEEHRFLWHARTGKSDPIPSIESDHLCDILLMLIRDHTSAHFRAEEITPHLIL